MRCSRRDFLKVSLGASTLFSLGSTVPEFLGRSALALEPRRREGDSILVVVQLSGGNDGLNTLVPFEDDNYARHRQTLRLRGNQVLKIDSLLGFHPKMQAFRRLYDDGLLGAIQGTGYPHPSGDHGASMMYWQTACPHDPSCQTGWVGRAADHLGGTGREDCPALFAGTIPRPIGLNAEKVIVPSIRSLQDLVARGPGDVEESAPASGGDDEILDFLRRSRGEAREASRKVEEVLGDSRGGIEYPPFPFAGMLRTIARLIRADLGIRIFFTELGGPEPGGFDNHANQRDNHAALLRQLSEAVGAFVKDLKRDGLLDRMLLMTFSEFGRTVAENGRRGTGHGSAAPIFLAGGRLRGGLTGPHPGLTELENGGPKFHTDFRRVYATVLDGWLGIDSKVVLGEKYEPLDVFKGA